MPIGSNIWQKGRLELLYLRPAKQVWEFRRKRRINPSDGLEYSTEANDGSNGHDRDTPQGIRFQKVIKDAALLLPKLEEDYGDAKEYQLLEITV